MNEYANAIALWLLIVNVLGFFLMGIDKMKAKRRTWRIPERTLFVPALLGGTPGTIVGMYTFRHKTRHRNFKCGLSALLAVQLIVLGIGWRLV